MSLLSRFRWALFAGTLAGAVSEWTLVRRGRRDVGSAAAPVNAPSHWMWGEESIRCGEADLRHTVLGTAVHWASSVLWGVVYQALRTRRRRPGALDAIGDAAAVTAVAALVDLRVVPPRLTPGFERQLSRASLFLVYACFAAGLAAAGIAHARRGPAACSRPGRMRLAGHPRLID